jgi:hypothetical protein
MSEIKQKGEEKIKTEPEDKTDTVDYMRIAKNMGLLLAILLAKYGFLFSILGMIGVFVLALAMPFGVSIYTPSQLVSIFGFEILLLIFSLCLDYYIKD